jgi:hypothetical protein
MIKKNKWSSRNDCIATLLETKLDKQAIKG